MMTIRQREDWSQFVIIKTSLLLLTVSVLILKGHSLVGIPSLRQECCSLGESSAKNFTNVTCRDLFLRHTPRSYRGTEECYLSFEPCCLKEQEATACSTGIKAARTPGTDCYHVKSNDRSFKYWQAYEDCCTACKAGIDTANKTMSCNKNAVVGALYDATFQSCCEVTISGMMNMRPTDRCKTSQNRCSHRCSDPGPTHPLRCICNEGYTLSKDLLTCEDENECVLNPLICGREMCINSLGSFYCRPHNAGPSWGTERVVKKPSAWPTSTPTHSPPRNPEYNICPLGYELDTTDAESCIDIDECLDGSYDCPDHLPVCKNTIGSYACLANDVQETRIYEPSSSTGEGAFRTETSITVFSTSSLPDTCTQGYKLSSTGKCLDIDECSIGKHDCNLTFERCENLVGEYRCIALDLNVDVTKKLDDLPSRIRYPNQVSTVSPITSPSPPYAIPHIHQELPFSQENYVSTRPSNSFSHTTPTISAITSPPIKPRYPLVQQQSSSCKRGYKWSPLKGQCEDINECAEINLCEDQGLRCDNTLGSYQCVRMGTCGTGWVWNPDLGKCEDIDECSRAESPCLQKLEICENKPGSFSCKFKTCPPGQFLSAGFCWVTECGVGFQFDERTHNCIDIDECQPRPGVPPACNLNEECINVQGSFRCEVVRNCPRGYEWSRQEKECIDFNECLNAENHTCSSNEMCINEQGTYSCTCQNGFEFNRSNMKCEDIDECKMGTMCPHPSRGLCVNIIGSFYCHCISGYRQNTTSLNLCDDIDECQEGTHNCEQKCTNTVGGFECSCHDGYEPLRSRSYSPGEFTCIDINECEKDVNLRNEDPSRPKLCEGTCTNTDGGYECSCPNGYFLNLTNNRTCEDIDECTSNTLICQSSDVCLNTRGGYKCFEFKCPDKYEEDASKVNQCRRKERCLTEGPNATPGCAEEPTIYTYDYITIPSKLKIPLQTRRLSLFSLSGRAQDDFVYRYSFQVLRVVTDKENVVPVNRSFFDLVQNYHESEFYIVRTIEGPQTIELEITVKIMHQGETASTMVSKVFIHVSEFEY